MHSGDPGLPECAMVPESCRLIREAFGVAGRGLLQTAKFSVMWDSLHVAMHCGTDTGKLRILIPLHLPPGGKYSMNVGGERVPPAVEGSALVFDDSLEHEVWVGAPPAKTSIPRIVLLIDVTHPDLLE